MYKCKMCGKETAKDLCSFECRINWIQSEEFDKELDDYLNVFTESWYKQQIKQTYAKIELFNSTLTNLEEKMKSKFGDAIYNKVMLEIGSEKLKNEESDNI